MAEGEAQVILSEVVCMGRASMKAPKPLILSQGAEKIERHTAVAFVFILNTICHTSTVRKFISVVASLPTLFILW